MSVSSSIINDLNDNKRPLLALLVVSIVAYGFYAFNLTVTGDDWWFTVEELCNYHVLVSMGRYTTELFLYVHGGATLAPAYYILLALLLFGAGSLLVAKKLGLHSDLSRFIFISLLLFSPFFSEGFSFKYIPPTFGLAIFLIGVSVYYVDDVVQGKNRPFMFARYILACVLLALAFGVQQAFILLYVEIVLFHFITRVAFSEDLKKDVKFFLTYSSSIVVSYLIYVFTCNATAKIFATPLLQTGRYSMTVVDSVESVCKNIVELGPYLWQFFFEQQPLWPQFVKYIFLPFALLWIVGLLRVALKTKKYAIIKTIACLVGTAAFFLVPWLICVVPKFPVIRYNSLIAASVIYAGIFSQLPSLVGDPRLKRLSNSAALLIIAVFVFWQCATSVSLYATNLRDFHVTSRILSRIDTYNAINGLSPSQPNYYLIGKLKEQPQIKLFGEHSTGPIKITASMFNLYELLPSRFSCIVKFIDYPQPGHVYANLFDIRTVFSILSKVKVGETPPCLVFQEKLKAAQVWPLQQSIFNIGDNYFIVLSKTELEENQEEFAKLCN